MCLSVSVLSDLGGEYSAENSERVSRVWSKRQRFRVSEELVKSLQMILVNSVFLLKKGGVFKLKRGIFTLNRGIFALTRGF